MMNKSSVKKMFCSHAYLGFWDYWPEFLDLCQTSVVFVSLVTVIERFVWIGSGARVEVGQIVIETLIAQKVSACLFCLFVAAVFRGSFPGLLFFAWLGM